MPNPIDHDILEQLDDTLEVFTLIGGNIFVGENHIVHHELTETAINVELDNGYRFTIKIEGANA